MSILEWIILSIGVSGKQRQDLCHMMPVSNGTLGQHVCVCAPLVWVLKAYECLMPTNMQIWVEVGGGGGLMKGRGRVMAVMQGVGQV